MLTLPEAAKALIKFNERYRYMDVFASDVAGLDQVVGTKVGKEILSQVDGRQLRIEELPNGVLRLSLESAMPTAVAAGGVVGALLGGAASGKNRALGGLILGMLVGAMVNGQPEMNRVMALHYDDASHTWQLYDGPLLKWAKQQLAP